MLAVVLAAPFLLLILVGIWVPIVRNLKSRQERDQQVQPSCDRCQATCRTHDQG